MKLNHFFLYIYLIILLLSQLSCKKNATHPTPTATQRFYNASDTSQPGILRSLTQAEAVLRAEIFIQQQGYTDTTPITFKGVQLEAGEFKQKDTANILQKRKNTLQKKSIYSIQQQGKGKKKWNVFFKNAQNDSTARKVVMDSAGASVLLHPNIIKKIDTLINQPN